MENNGDYLIYEPPYLDFGSKKSILRVTFGYFRINGFLDNIKCDDIIAIISRYLVEESILKIGKNNKAINKFDKSEKYISQIAALNKEFIIGLVNELYEPKRMLSN